MLLPPLLGRWFWCAAFARRRTGQTRWTWHLCSLLPLRAPPPPPSPPPLLAGQLHLNEPRLSTEPAESCVQTVSLVASGSGWHSSPASLPGGGAAEELCSTVKVHENSSWLLINLQEVNVDLKLFLTHLWVRSDSSLIPGRWRINFSEQNLACAGGGREDVRRVSPEAKTDQVFQDVMPLKKKTNKKQHRPKETAYLSACNQGFHK